MNSNLDHEELGKVLQLMRVMAPDIGEDKFQVMLDAQDYLLDSGFLDAVWGIVRLQEEEDINISDAIDKFQSLLTENKKLISKRDSLKEKIVQDQAVHQTILNDIDMAKKELEVITGQIKEGKDELTALVIQAENENIRIDSELEKHRQKAGITKTEMKAAGSLKSAVKKSGFSLDTILSLVKEFFPYKDARERLIKALEREGSLTREIASLEKEMEAKTGVMNEAITKLASEKSQCEDELNELKRFCHQWETKLEQLQSDVDEEQRLRQFWIRYQSAVSLLECLAGWKQVLFLRCDNPGCEPFGGINHFWSEKQAIRCPHCGGSYIHYDEELYNVLNLEMRPFKLILG